MTETMKPYKERTPDYQYHDLLKYIMEKGRDMMPIHGIGARSIVGHQIRYKLENGFPLITERDLARTMPGALGEHVGFLNGARTLDELKKYGMPAIFWDRWVTKEKCADFGLPEGDLGPGSYGAASGAFPPSAEAPLHQQKAE